MTSAYEDRLQAYVGRFLNERTPGQDPVNLPMIRHWVEAMELSNPIHLDADAARANGRDGVVAPASMVQAWTMRGYAATVREGAAPAEGQTSNPASAGARELVDLLAEGGYTSVVATDSEFDFVREVAPGDEITVEEVVESISPEKATGLGTGRFVTTLKTYRDASGAAVATQRWRTLRFKPVAQGEPREQRPRPAINPDNAFFFEAARERRLVVQRCVACQTLRHPPGPQCPHCQSFDWDTVDCSGRATLYSYIVAHHPRHPAFDYPLLVAVVELAEGTRLITNLTGITPDEVEIGMPLTVQWIDDGPDLTLPVFGPAEEN